MQAYGEVYENPTLLSRQPGAGTHPPHARPRPAARERPAGHSAASVDWIYAVWRLRMAAARGLREATDDSQKKDW